MESNAFSKSIKRKIPDIFFTSLYNRVFHKIIQKSYILTNKSILHKSCLVRMD